MNDAERTPHYNIILLCAAASGRLSRTALRQYYIVTILRDGPRDMPGQVVTRVERAAGFFGERGTGSGVKDKREFRRGF